MIERYSHLEMKEIWSEKTKLSYWTKVELEALRATPNGIVPRQDRAILIKALEKVIRDKSIDPAEVKKIEEVTKHDVIAFTTVLAKKVGPSSRFIHFGMTSSDVVDTAFSLQIRDAGVVLLRELDQLLKVLKKLSVTHQNLPCMGRSHGIFAEPTTLGLKFLGFYSEWWRVRQRLQVSLEDCRYGKVSGAVGTHTHFGPSFEERIMKNLKLNAEPMSTQVVPRDRHAYLMSSIAILAGALERISIELRHLQRSEVGEVREGFSAGQKGSSAMPHKRNPISAENLTGCARVLRSYSLSTFENIALWHERDISHSSVERIVFPDAFILAAYSLKRLTNLLSRLEVQKDMIQLHLGNAGTTVFSGHLLLALVKAGAPREEAYYWVQNAALKAIDLKSEFLVHAKSNAEISKYFSASQIEKICTYESALKHVPQIFKRAFAKMKL